MRIANILAILTYNYGANLLKLKNYADAEPVLDTALQRYENVYGKESAELIPVLMDLGHKQASEVTIACDKPACDGGVPYGIIQAIRIH